MILTNNGHFHSVFQVEDKYNVDTIIAFPQNKNMINTLTFLPDWFTKAQQNDGDEKKYESNDTSNDCS